MKKEYTAPEIEVVTFATEDVMAEGGSGVDPILQDALDNGEGKATWE